ncbi:YdeI/OmpD-associated family protein [Streptomyces sp. ISL-10]|uniref:YdeI/OmpD-associated family protein n=1 Tax=Streptomyces sp. ISL-10 TaxID=2819172 RepID=UPI001BEACC66|nr:YdeI/OmpD-associated family protein [Streptomyces sp. ISL-10]MBT2364222.1 YdeI/OmpD-associated family protein [Streptomyces sp. ISL-10]
MDMMDGLPLLPFAGLPELEAWLEENHGTAPGLWVALAKKGSGVPSPSAGDVNDAALCFGWITGLRRSCDEVRYLQKISPRRPRSTWSQVNVKRVAELTAAGRMREPGLAEVASAEADGRWEAAYASQREAEVPPDLAAALRENPRARETFESLGRSDRYQVVLALLKARTDHTRRARLERTVAALAAGEKAS